MAYAEALRFLNMKSYNVLLLRRGESFNANFFYFSGLDIDNCYFVKNGNERLLLVSKLNEELAKERFHGKVIVCEDFWKELKGLLKGKEILIDGNGMPARAYERLLKVCKVKKIHDVSEDMFKERSMKKMDEIEKISKAVAITKKMVESLDFRGMKTEGDVRKYLLMNMIELGVEPSFNPIVASGKNTRYPHYRNGNGRLREMVLVDCGVRYKNYCADLTRCFFFDGERARRAEKDYEKLREMVDELLYTIQECSDGKGVAAVATALYRKRKRALIHSIGHGIGLEVHEYPRLSRRFSDAIAGTTFTIEPGFYQQEYGVRYEETVYYDGRKLRVL